MEKELLKDYKPLLARLDQVREIQYQPLEQSDVKQLIYDVLNEIQSGQKLITNEGRTSNQDH